MSAHRELLAVAVRVSDAGLLIEAADLRRLAMQVSRMERALDEIVRDAAEDAKLAEAARAARASDNIVRLPPRLRVATGPEDAA